MTADEDERIVDPSPPALSRSAGEGDVGGDGDMEALLAAEREKAETYYRNWQRSAADFINYKRRVEQERSESARMPVPGRAHGTPSTTDRCRCRDR